MARRRSRTSFDVRIVPFVAALILLGVAYSRPGFAFLVAVVFAVLALSIWLVGAQDRIRELHRWGTVSNMYALSPEAFESHVADTYAALGYTASVTPRVGDQGIDVLAQRGQERIGIQCKRTTEAVSNGAVQEAYAGKAHYQCSSASVIALGGFTRAARSLASTTGVALVDGAAYADLFHRASAALPRRAVWNVPPKRRAATNAVACACVALGTFAVGLAGVNAPPSTLQVVGSGSVAQRPRIGSPGDAVRRFYSAINARDFPIAYAYLSPSFRRSMSLAAFEHGYATTTSVVAETAQDESANVAVRLVATDRKPDGTTQTSTFDGHWSVVASPSGGWFLDDGRFHAEAN